MIKLKRSNHEVAMAHTSFPEHSLDRFTLKEIHHSKSPCTGQVWGVLLQTGGGRGIPGERKMERKLTCNRRCLLPAAVRRESLWHKAFLIHHLQIFTGCIKQQGFKWQTMFLFGLCLKQCSV